ncbi:MAG TPA: RNA-binding S4 domain-containing protein [Bacillota bacterium]|nr:RNA-binding S4 domain-containing protein [Bacillota bacterium]
MRLDKYLKVSRIIKRRTLGKEVCDKGKVTINGRVAKASSEVKAGDTLEIDFGSRQLKVEVLLVLETVKAQDAKEIYRVLS